MGDVKAYFTRCLVVAAILSLMPTVASAQYGLFMGSADLDGDGIVENVYNNGGTINVVSSSTVTPYYIGFTSWALLYGNFSSVVDLDGQPGAEIPVNVGSSLLIITHRTRSTNSYQMLGTWAAAPGGIVDQDGVAGKEITIVAAYSIRTVNQRLRSVHEYNMQGQFAVIGAAISDLDGIAGAEVPIANGPYLRIYAHRTYQVFDFYVSPGSWAVCTSGSNCVSNMDGNPGNELLLILPYEMKVVRLYNGVGSMTGSWIGAQYAILSDGVRDFNGIAGNDIAMARSDGNINILYPYNGYLQLISGYGTFGQSWTLLGYGNFDGVAGDEIRVQSQTNNLIYRIYPRSGTVSRE